MRAGQLDREITIQSPPTGRNADGSPNRNGTWTDVAMVWARKRDASAQELVEGRARQGEVETVFTIRHRTDVTHDMRVKYGSEIWLIEGITEIGRSEALQLACRRLAE